MADEVSIVLEEAEQKELKQITEDTVKIIEDETKQSDQSINGQLKYQAIKFEGLYKQFNKLQEVFDKSMLYQASAITPYAMLNAFKQQEAFKQLIPPLNETAERIQELAMEAQSKQLVSVYVNYKGRKVSYDEIDMVGSTNIRLNSEHQMVFGKSTLQKKENSFATLFAARDSEGKVSKEYKAIQAIKKAVRDIMKNNRDSANEKIDLGINLGDITEVFFVAGMSMAHKNMEFSQALQEAFVNLDAIGGLLQGDYEEEGENGIIAYQIKSGGFSSAGLAQVHLLAQEIINSDNPVQYIRDKQAGITAAIKDGTMSARKKLTQQRVENLLTVALQYINADLDGDIKTWFEDISKNIKF